MKRKLLLLNIALLVVLAAAGWRIWQVWNDARAREDATFRQFSEAAQVFPEPAVKSPAPVIAINYIGIAEQLLFARDRNPVVEIDVAPPKPLPPMPVAHGVLDLGSGPTVILSERQGEAAQRGYRSGEHVGELLLVSVTADELVFEWEGERIRRSLDELRPQQEESETVRRSTPPPPKPAPAKAKSAVISASPASKAGPSEIEMGGGIRACQPGDTSPPGTVVDGLRKVVTSSPFGKSCRWEPVQ